MSTSNSTSSASLKRCSCLPAANYLTSAGRYSEENSVTVTVHRWEPQPRKFVEKLTVTDPVKWQFSLSPFPNDGNRRQHLPSGSELKRVSRACVCVNMLANRCLNTWYRQRVFWRPNGTNHSVQPVSLRCCISLLGRNEPYVTEAHVTHNSWENAPAFPKPPHIKECGLEDFTWGKMWMQAINLALFSF